MAQAVDKKERYSPVIQHNVKVGDLVLLKEVHTKLNNYPMGLIKKIEINSNEEVTGALVLYILKGKTCELVKRHISTLIPLLEGKYISMPNPDNSSNDIVNDNVTDSARVRRKAAVVSERRTRQLLD